jgi:hypothetical protein
MTQQPERVSLWEPPPRQEPAPPPPQRPWLPKPPWYRRAWFVGLVVTIVSAAAGALAGSHLP